MTKSKNDEPKFKQDLTNKTKKNNDCKSVYTTKQDNQYNNNKRTRRIYQKQRKSNHIQTGASLSIYLQKSKCSKDKANPNFSSKQTKK